jgi:hypothetical protein
VLCVLVAYVGFLNAGQPRTVRFEFRDWQNTSWGFHSIDRSYARCEVAISRDGSHIETCEWQSFRYHFIPSARERHHGIHLRSGGPRFIIDHKNRSITQGQCFCAADLAKPIPAGPECTQVARSRMQNASQTGTDEIAGQRVVRYFGFNNGGAEVELALAPALGCETMEEIHTYRGWAGLPAGKWEYRIHSYALGEPDPSVFRLPSDYRRSR